MAQRQATSANDRMTIAGLLVLGLTSGLVGALIVAPTLAPKRMALAIELPEPPASASVPKKPLESDQSSSILDSSANAPANTPADGTGATALGNEPSGILTDAESPTANGPETTTDASPVTIRKPGELTGPPAPFGLTSPSILNSPESQEALGADRRLRPVDRSQSGLTKSRDEAGLTGVPPREQPGSEANPRPSERRNPPGGEAPEPDKEGPDKEADAAPGEEEDGERSGRSTRVFRVQSGKFNTRDEALRVQLELAKAGKNGVIVPAGDGFRLQLGVFRSRNNADKTADAARQQNIVVDVRPERQGQR